MRIYVLFVAVAFGWFMLASSDVDAEGYEDRYLIAYHTYAEITPMKYNVIYKSVRDDSARRTMIDAARDYCRNEVDSGRFFGPKSERPFDCTSF